MLGIGMTALGRMVGRSLLVLGFAAVGASASSSAMHGGGGGNSGTLLTGSSTAVGATACGKATRKSEDLYGYDSGPDFEEAMLMHALGPRVYERHLSRGGRQIPPEVLAKYPGSLLMDFGSFVSSEQDANAMLSRLLVRQGRLTPSQAAHVMDLGIQIGKWQGTLGHLRCKDCEQRRQIAESRVEASAPRVFEDLTRPQRVRIYRLMQKIGTAQSILSFFISATQYGDDFRRFLAQDSSARQRREMYLSAVERGHSPMAYGAIEKDFDDTLTVLFDYCPGCLVKGRQGTTHEEDLSYMRARSDAARAAEGRLGPFDW